MSKPLRHLGPILTLYKMALIIMFTCKNIPYRLVLRTTYFGNNSSKNPNKGIVIRMCLAGSRKMSFRSLFDKSNIYYLSVAPDGPIQQLLQLQNSATWGHTKIYNCTYQQREGKAAVSQNNILTAQVLLVP